MLGVVEHISSNNLHFLESYHECVTDDTKGSKQSMLAKAARGQYYQLRMFSLKLRDSIVS